MAKKREAAQPQEPQGENEDGAGFEELLGQTEELVDRLESGGLGLEEALRLYEQGVGNLRRCAKVLSVAEKRVKLLVEKSAGGAGLEDFPELAGQDNPDDDDEEADGA